MYISQKSKVSIRGITHYFVLTWLWIPEQVWQTPDRNTAGSWKVVAIAQCPPSSPSPGVAGPAFRLLTSDLLTLVTCPWPLRSHLQFVFWHQIWMMIVFFLPFPCHVFEILLSVLSEACKLYFTDFWNFCHTFWTFSKFNRPNNENFIVL